MKVTKTICGLCALALTVGLGLVLKAQDQEAPMPKHTIKAVMKAAHARDTGILNKVKKGNATADEKKELLDLYISLLESTPPKGEADSWHKLSGAAVVAAAKVVVGRENAVAELAKATNCGACHRAHKPPSQ